ncbi:hypothetical protein F8M41_015216 [Gigaspora margarita]|uniref:Uncharacterized protein n=1 Tax=Gigaspora margarita TaxID=4874 RepID=A0A8H3WWR2_GIGMA|nr:hypothetical protein F8M41_015216 [Gigaspora margarita]
MTKQQLRESHPSKEQQTLENQEGEPSSGMVLRKQKKVFNAKSSDSGCYVKNARSKRYVRDIPVSRERTPCITTCSL